MRSRESRRPSRRPNHRSTPPQRNRAPSLSGAPMLEGKSFQLVLGVSGCGAEVSGTAALVGAAKVKEAEQAQKQPEQVRQRLDAAAEFDRQRRAAAERQQ